MTFEEKLDNENISSCELEDFRTDKTSKGIILPCYFCHDVYFRTDDFQDEKFINCNDCHDKAIRFHCL